MEIVYHHRTLLDGAEGIHVREMIRAFETLGYHVTVVSPAGSDGRGATAGAVRRLLPHALFECATATHNLIEFGQLRRLLARTRPVLVYKRHALNDVAMLQAARQAAIPSVLEVNTLYTSDEYQRFEPLRLARIARALEARAFGLASLVVAVSTPLAALVQRVAPRVRPLVLPNGADPSQFVPATAGALLRAQLGFTESQLVIGWSGAVRAWHGLELPLEALRQRPSHALLIIGDGPGAEPIRAEAARLGLSGRVRFAGKVSRTDMPRHLAAIDVGLVADDGTKYASPMKLVEYMAMGKPAVAPDLANIRDIITPERDGLLFTPGDAASLGAQLDRLMDRDLRERLGTAARARVVGERNWVANARAVIDAVAHIDTPLARHAS